MEVSGRTIDATGSRKLRGDLMRSPIIVARVVALALVGAVTASPAWAGATKTRPQNEDPRAERIDRYMAAYGDDSPGAALAVVREGELVFAGGYGMANLEHAVPITPRTVFYLASVGKQFTAFAVALLASEGKLSLDDPVDRYVEELPDFERPITIRQLIHHTSGLRNTNGLLALRGVRDSDLVTQGDVLELIFAQRELNFPPGTEHLYSNSGYVLLATIVERVAGRSFRVFMKERIFEPLGMTSTDVVDEPDVIIRNRAESYIDTGGEFRRFIRPYSVYGPGGIYSTAEDVARWIAHLQSPRFGAAAVRRMEERGMLTSGYELGYAFGLDVTFDPESRLELIGHDGEHGGYRTYAGRVPAERLGVVVLGNVDSFDACAAALELVAAFASGAAHLLEGADARVAIHEEALRSHAGLYAREGGGYDVRFSVEKDGLMAQFGLEAALIPRTMEDWTLQMPCIVSGSVSFHPDTDGVTDRGSFLGTPIVRVPDAGWSPDRETLAGYPGRYRSPELDTVYEIVLAEGRLIARHRRHDDIFLTPKREDVFEGSESFASELRFERDATGSVTGVRISGFRVLNVRFDRLRPGDH